MVMVSAAINLSELEQELTHTKALFDKWSITVQANAQACKASHSAALIARKEELAALTERYQRAEKQAAQVREQMAHDNEHEQALRATADSLLTEQHALQKRLQQLTLEFDVDAQRVQQLQSEVDQTRGDLDLRLAKLDQLHNTYKNVLGLTLQSSNGELYLEFTQIDTSNPERPFGFAVQVTDDTHYRVTRCQPEVPGRTGLEQQLMEGKIGFAMFVRAMRQQFIEVAESQPLSPAPQQQLLSPAPQ